MRARWRLHASCGRLLQRIHAAEASVAASSTEAISRPRAAQSGCSMPSCFIRSNWFCRE